MESWNLISESVLASIQLFEYCANAKHGPGIRPKLRDELKERTLAAVKFDSDERFVQEQKNVIAGKLMSLAHTIDEPHLERYSDLVEATIAPRRYRRQLMGFGEPCRPDSLPDWTPARKFWLSNASGVGRDAGRRHLMLCIPEDEWGVAELARVAAYHGLQNRLADALIDFDAKGAKLLDGWIVRILNCKVDDISSVLARAPSNMRFTGVVESAEDLGSIIRICIREADGCWQAQLQFLRSHFFGRHKKPIF